MSGTAKHFAQLPKPSYYAVIFSSLRTSGGSDDGKAGGYGRTAERMVELAKVQPGYLGVESVRGADGFGITVSYWKDEASIRTWKAHAEHLIAQETGIRHWYEHYELRIAKVERSYGKQPQREDVQTNDDVAVVWGGQ
jgi:heme-degrading monooxygenase HmoA